MKICILGAGNMGGAIARGLAANSEFDNSNLIVASPNHKHELDDLKSEFPTLNVTTDNATAVSGAQMIIVAVKPWMVDEVLKPLKNCVDFEKQLLVSVAAGVKLEHLAAIAGSDKAAVFALIPNIAATVGQSMTFISALNADEQQIDLVKQVFNLLGETMVVSEKLLGPCTAISSCGIAYVLRFIHASQQAAVELGLHPAQALEIMCQTLSGVVELMRNTGEHPEATIYRVTTPGGMAIRGLNTMEERGFSYSVISGIKASLK